MDSMIYICEVIGTIAFSISGAFVGLRNRSDVFGVMVLGTVTATGGGMIRDVILGRIPPAAFVRPVYVFIALATALAVFCLAAWLEKAGRSLSDFDYKDILFYMDSIGLGIFAVVGVNTAVSVYGYGNGFLCVFCGMITGVGGGLLRDVMVCHQPDILTKDIYAVAAIIGGFTSLLLFRAGHPAGAIWLPAILIVIIRIIARHFGLNLPKVINFRED